MLINVQSLSGTTTIVNGVENTALRITCFDPEQVEFFSADDHMTARTSVGLKSGDGFDVPMTIEGFVGVLRAHGLDVF